MFSRRTFLKTTAVASIGLAGGTALAAAQEACAVFTPGRQKAITPDEAIALLKEGNARFVSGATINCDLRAQVKATSASQSPFAAVVGCIDSRVPPELVFDQRLGAIFAARIAGNFVNTDIIGSLEFATKLAGAKAIVVLGHSECGAIKGAIDNARLGNLTAMLKNFRPAVAAARDVPGDRSSKNKELVKAVTTANVELTAKKLLARSNVLSELVAQGQLVVAAAVHDLATGQLTWKV